jgi:hypothetical protein
MHANVLIGSMRFTLDSALQASSRLRPHQRLPLDTFSATQGGMTLQLSTCATRVRCSDERLRRHIYCVLVCVVALFISVGVFMADHGCVQASASCALQKSTTLRRGRQTSADEKPN